MKVWCAYIGGSKTDWPRGGLALDRQDNVYLVGGTDSSDFPTTEETFRRRPRGERDAAIVKLSADGAELLFGTLLGGSSWDGLMGIQVDKHGDVYVAGYMRSTDFPVTSAALQSTQRGGRQPQQGDGILAVLSPDGSRPDCYMRRTWEVVETT